jgi:Protein of unknown function (DUF1553)/Protein of unknown function (DUF1549)/Concanavalin A-like lectin/glucanases superfamily/Planctomycete cytochrome C
MNRRAALSLLAVPLLAVLSPGAAPPAPVRFGRDILPILSAQCFQCHGPDAHARKAKLRLDTHDGALGVITPGKVDESEIIRRITSTDDDERMPPPKTNRVLTAADKDILRRWVGQGAPWGRHWAYETPERPAVPEISNSGSQIRNPIDAFVVDRLHAEGIKPSPEAIRESLIRRVTFDLTGLPPTPREIDDFVSDQSPDAYERVVDRLLASPRYGERQAVDWLDVARFADSNGYQNDFARTMWPWRDWVIAAFNRNQPFDQFVIEQMAGDLLPNATVAQKIATGFNRNNRTVTEAGSIDEEWRIENAVDRVETTAAAFLGLTVGCCRCHDHKFDPISQREFYQLLAFFNSVNEQGVYTERPGNVPPMIPVRGLENERQIKQLDAAIAAAETAVREREAALPAHQRQWEEELRTRLRPAEPPDGAVRIALNGDLDVQAADSPPRAVYRGPGQPTWEDSPFGHALRLNGKEGAFVDAGQVVDAERTKPISYGAWVKPHGSGAVLSKMDDAAGFRGFDLLLTPAEGTLPARRVQVHMVHHWPDNALKVTTRDPVPADTWSHLFITYDGSGKAAGLRIYIDGRQAEQTVQSDTLTGTIDTPQPLRLGSRAASLALNGDLADVRIVTRTLPAAEVQALAFQPLTHLLEMPPDQRPAAGKALLDQVYRAAYAIEWTEAKAKVAQAREAKSAYEKTIPTTMVMEDLPKPRPTYLLKRGQYDQPDKTQQVQPGVPACLPTLNRGDEKPPANRLDLAHWLVDPANPLTARIAVNRFWQQFFGAGLVKTSEDFGVRGDSPSHPLLLDWLATEFVASGWDVKRLQRLIVTSATYRQLSIPSPDLLRRDPENRLLARGPRFRLPAEAVRDAALAASGLLAGQVGGPSVKPYQPAGLWEELAGGAGEGKYVQDTGPNLYRRSLYVYRKRTVPQPELATLDAPSREVCQVKRSRTNTPLQALQLLNDVTYVEAARNLARRMLTEGGDTPADRIAFGFRLATARRPTADESALLIRGLERYRKTFGADPEAAKRFIRNGDSPVDDALDPAELAAYQTVASVILNMSETITRE